MSTAHDALSTILPANPILVLLLQGLSSGAVASDVVKAITVRHA
jgi:hypothetical protein